MSTECQRSRRNFLKTSLLGAAAALAATKSPAAMAAQAATAAGGTTAPGAATGSAAAITSRVSLVAGEDRAKIAFDSLTPFKREIAAAIGNRRVVLKPNNVMINRPLCASDARNLEGILEFLHSIGKTNIVIAESPANGSALDGFHNYGYDKLAAKYNATMISLDSEDYSINYVMDEHDLQPHAIRTATMLMDPKNNFVISAAKLKTHDMIGITLSLKNIVVGSGIKDSGYGVSRMGPGRGRSDKPMIHGGGPHGINYNVFTLSAKLHPDLAVIDGYEGMQGDGPINGSPVDQKVCLASLDWLAADRVGAELMGVDFSKIGYLSYCAKAGDRGQGDLAKIQVVGEKIEDHMKTYQLPPTWDHIMAWQKPIAAA